MTLTIITDAYNCNKQWYVKHYNDGHYYLNQSNGGRMLNRRYTRISQTQALDILQIEKPERKRKKMRFWDVIALGIEYHSRAYGKMHNVPCEAFQLSKPLTAEQLKAVNGYKNTSIGTCTHRYAPEIHYSVLYLYDKCIR